MFVAGFSLPFSDPDLAIHLATDREDAYWILSTGVEDSAVPGELGYLALLDFSRALAPGPFRLRVEEAGRA